MIDLRRLRSEPDAVKAAIARRGEDITVLDRVLTLDSARRAKAQERDDLRGRVNEISKQVGVLFKDGRADEAKELQAESKALGAQERKLDAAVDAAEAEIREALLVVSNIPSADAPDGAGAADNVETRVEGPGLDSYGEHQRVTHWDIAAEHGLLDLERGAKLSGSMFVMFRGAGARLSRALIQLGLDRNADAFEEIRPPTFVRTETMISTGHLPKFIDDAYHMERDDLWAIPTAEVPLTSLARDEILDEADLPMRLMAHTACFRRESGSAGRDTRGLLRVHEFDKVEILSYCTPDQAAEVHADLLARAEGTIRALGFTYRILDLCTGDLGNSSARTFDIEVYAPGVDQWLEVSSVSWFSDYQARRANVRYRPSDGTGVAVCHTLNGSALAVPRVWAALVEVYRQPDGSVAVPELLQPYLGGSTTLTP